MSGMEKQELHDRIKAMTPDEYKVTVECIPSKYLLDELVRRDIKKTQMILDVRKAVKVNGNL